MGRSQRNVRHDYPQHAPPEYSELCGEQLGQSDGRSFPSGLHDNACFQVKQKPSRKGGQKGATMCKPFEQVIIDYLRENQNNLETVQFIGTGWIQAADGYALCYDADGNYIKEIPLDDEDKLTDYIQSIT